MKHTKGPWKVMPSSNKKNGSSWRDIVSGNGLPYDGCYIGEALEQDAYLIAAAPEMLEMLKTIEDCYMSGDPIPYVELDELIKRAGGE